MARKKKVSPGNRLVAYYRYSGGSQQTEQSIEGQRRDCEAYARQHGLTIVHEYIDRHISGRGVESRLAFQQMIADSSKHLFDLVICWKTDRFARNRYDSAVYKKKLRDNGVRILYAAESSVEGPEGIILEGLMESLAEYYSAELAQKMRRGMRESALKGRAINPSRPLGLTTDEHKRFIIDEKNAPTIRFIFEHYAAGESSASIVEQLNAAGLRTSKGNAFNKCSIPRIIQNEAYHGVYICKAYDVRIDGAIPAIIDDDLWKRAQKMLTLNKQHRAPHSSHADYLLSGKLFCGCCHSLMRGISGHNCRNDVYYYYACGNKADDGTCKKKNIPKDVAENLVVNAICENILRPDTLEDLADAIAAAQQADVNQPDPERAMLEQNLADVHRKINNIIESIENGTASSRLSARLADLEQQESTLNYQLESLKEVHPPVLDRERILTRTILLSTPPPILSTYFFQILLFLVHSIRCIIQHLQKLSRRWPMIQRVSRQHLHFLRVSFPCQLCRPANSALHSPPSMTRSFRHRQINFLLQGSQPVRPGANQRHTLPENIIIILCANDTQRAQQVVKLCISHSNTSFHPSCYAFCRKKSKTQTQPRGTVRLPGAVVSCRSFLPPAASARPQHESAPPGWAHPSVRHSPRY